MKLAKRLMIWAAVMLVVTFCINTVGTIVVKTIFSDMLTPTMLGYTARAERMLHPTLKEPDEEDKTNGLSGLVIRSLLDDTRIVDGSSFLTNFAFMNVKIDQSVILFEKDGMSGLSSGIFTDIYEDTGDNIDHIRNTVGLMSVRDFCELDCAADIYEMLENHSDAVIKIDSYSISSFVVQPASITILDGSGNTLGSFDCPCSGEIIRSENTFIHDMYSGYHNDPEYSFHSFYYEMRDAYLGERRSDKIAEKLVDDVSFENGDQDSSKPGFGFGHYFTKSYEVRDNYAMIFVFDYNFMSSVIIYMIIAAIPVTFLTFFLGRKKKNTM